MKRIIFFSTLALLASCSPRNRFYPVPVPDYTKDYILKAPNGNATAPATVEAYPVARYQDPANPDIMHEKHFVYRREAPRWKLDSEPSERVVLGEASGVRTGRTVAKSSESSVKSTKEMQSMKQDIQTLNANQKALTESQIGLLNALKNNQAPTSSQPNSNRTPTKGGYSPENQ